MPCSVGLTTDQRRILRTTLAQESQIVEHCNKIQHLMAGLLNELQCMNHVDTLDELACDKFIRTQASIECDMSSYEMVHGAVQMALTCDCVCIQSACFRMLYKWIPKLDMLRMKIVKIKKMCSEYVASGGSGSGSGSAICERIEKTVHKIVKLKPTSH
jgi:hypothetical protein